MRRLLLIAAGALVAGGSLLATAPAALAHNYVISSTPVAGDTLTELPDVFQVTTNEPLLTLDGSTAGFALQVVDAAGLHYETGCVTVEGATMSAEPRLGAAGGYTVLWQVVSEDGHTVSDQIPFTWAPADDAEVSEGTAAAPACGDALPGSAGTASPSAAPSDTPAATPEAAPASTVRLSDVLWIGGAVVAVGIAVAVTIIVLGRRRPTP